MKKILLINPPYTTFFDSKHFSISRPNKDGITTSIPHGLACLAGFLRGKNIAVRCLDLEVIPMSLEGILDLIKSENYEIVGFTSTTPLISTAIKIAQYLKENTSSILVLGGVHASAEPIETASLGVFDVVVVGEGELPLMDLCLGVPYERIPGVVYNNKINKRYDLIAKLDDLHFPAYDLFPGEMYKASTHRDIDPSFQQPYNTIVTSRGCPYYCKFCYSKGIFFNKVRMKSASKILSELEFIRKSNNIQQQQPLKVMFYDDTFTLYKPRILEFCKEIKRQDLKIVWGCNTRVDHIDAELLAMMKQAGCKCIYIGVENGNDEFLLEIDKQLSTEKIKNGVEIIKKSGIEISASYIIGVPGETRQSINNTMKFAAELNTDFAHFYTFTPDPGSPFYHDLKNRGLIKPLDWLNYDGLVARAALALGENITPAELRELTKDAYRFYYTTESWHKMWAKKFHLVEKKKQYDFLVKQYVN